MTGYTDFLDRKSQLGGNHGFRPVWMPDFLFDFQKSLAEWSILKGRAGISADCGLGKTPMQLVWAENVVRHTNRRVLITTPLAVSDQTVRQGEKFGVECARSKTGKLPDAARIIVTNYESLHRFDSADFIGMVADESSAIKSFDGKRRKEVTGFMRRLPYRLLCTATAAPNDYIELGTAAEALGELGYMDMLTRFFKQDTTIPTRIGLRTGSFKGWTDLNRSKYRFKHHAEQPFWRWVASWARACRRPSDLGFDDGRFELPPLIEQDTVVQSARPMDGFLFQMPAVGLREQREELRHTLRERCETAAALVQGPAPAVLWGYLNAECDLLEKMIPGSRQVKGSQTDDQKEEIFHAFTNGWITKLICKPKIGAWGLNWEHCARMTFFPSHSFEQYYQAVRRCWRFGQTQPVVVDVITTEGQKDVLLNLQRKAKQADIMFTNLVKYMTDSTLLARSIPPATTWEVPQWLT